MWRSINAAYETNLLLCFGVLFMSYEIKHEACVKSWWLCL